VDNPVEKLGNESELWSMGHQFGAGKERAPLACWVEIERRPWEGDMGQIFHFTDIGYYDTQAAAFERGIQWARAWLDSNF
jgi:hypothetical protein